MSDIYEIFTVKIPYWKGKRIIFTLDKIISVRCYIYRLGIWESHKLGYKYGKHKDEWGTRWNKFFDIWKGKS
jgi:hypothetical protein